MSVTRVRLAAQPVPALRTPDSGPLPQRPLLDAAGPFAVLGGERTSDGFPAAIRAGADTLFGPRGLCLAGDGGPLWVADTGHHRLLGWRRVPREDQVAADWVLGQPDFNREGRNAGGETGALSLDVPTGMARCGQGLAVADAWNHRVLLWDAVPHDSARAPDRILGQPGPGTCAANRGRRDAGADGLHWPSGVLWAAGMLFVADTGNRRVLAWDGWPGRDGAPADRVLGQHDFECRDENAGASPGAASMRWPHGLALWRGNLCVADAGNNRVMVWRGIPRAPGAPCDWILGQGNDRDVDHNRSLYWPRADTLNMPYGIATAGDWLVVADTANSRLLAWHAGDLATGAPARAVAGQDGFEHKGDNQWREPRRHSLSWPYGLHVAGDTVAIADSGNSRVLLWKHLL